MEIGKLTVSIRKDGGKGIARKLRRDGLVPGVIYGEGLEQPLHLTIDPKALKQSLDPAKRRNTVLDLTVEDGSSKKNITAMLWEWQTHAIKRTVEHVDLIAIDPSKEVEAEIPVELTGKMAGAIKGGQLHIERRTILVRAKPADIPSKVLLDISPLDTGDTMHISDLAFPTGVVSAMSEKLSICSCSAIRGDANDDEAGGETK